jgi:hypothetical protein
MKYLILIFVIMALPCAAQLNTNIIFISGAGQPNDNTRFDWSAGGNDYTNGNSITMQQVGAHWQLDGGYFSTNFPYTWYDVGFASWPPPDPTGMYQGQSPAGPPLLSPYLTNFWTLPGDTVSFKVSGRNFATTNNETALKVVLDTNIIFQSTASAGNGTPFSLDGRLQWDGTNIAYFTEMTSGDPLNPQMPVFGQLTNEVIGTNSFQIVPLDNTNGFVVLAASIITSRAPPGATNPAAGTTTLNPGSITFKTD